MTIETLTFESYENYLAWINKTTDASDSIDLANHEREHYEEARKRGYNPVYAAFVSSCDRLDPLAYSIDFIGKEPTQEDMIAICLAPTNPSSDDKKLALRLKSQLG